MACGRPGGGRHAASAQRARRRFLPPAQSGRARRRALPARGRPGLLSIGKVSDPGHGIRPQASSRGPTPGSMSHGRRRPPRSRPRWPCSTTTTCCGEVLAVRGLSCALRSRASAASSRCATAGSSWRRDTGIHSGGAGDPGGGLRECTTGPAIIPYVVPEPSDCWSPRSPTRSADLDEYVAMLRTVSSEAYEDPETGRGSGGRRRSAGGRGSVRGGRRPRRGRRRCHCGLDR